MLSSRMVFVLETPEMHMSPRVEAFIVEQRGRADRQWVMNVLNGSQETECIKARTDDFVILPDVVPEWLRMRGGSFKLNKDSVGLADVVPEWPRMRGGSFKLNNDSVGLAGEVPEWPRMRGSRYVSASQDSLRVAQAQFAQLNWLAIMTDTGLKTLRDLRGEHLALLKALKEQCVAAVKKEFEVGSPEILIFANYPPSVYTLHFHICCPFKVAASFDVFRMHSLDSIIHHLEMDPNYYCKYSLNIPVSNSSRLYHALMGTCPKSPKTIHGAVQGLTKFFKAWQTSVGRGII